MTPNEFRQIALNMPDVLEGSHMKHPDFRMNKRIFATLGYPDENWAVVMLRPEQQEMLVVAKPDIFRPVNGAWGRQGNTQILLTGLDAATASNAVEMAWENVMSR